MRNALGFVLDFTAVFVAMGALAGTTLGAIAFALLFGEAAPFYQCMDPSSLGPATTSSDRGNGTGDSGDDSKQPRPAPPTSRYSAAAKTLGNPSVYVDVPACKLALCGTSSHSVAISYCDAKSAPAPGRSAVKVNRTPQRDAARMGYLASS